WAQLSIQNIFVGTSALFDIATTTSSAYATSSIFRVNANGNVGIGTTSPSNKLEVAGNGYFTGNLTGSNVTATGLLNVSGASLLNDLTVDESGSRVLATHADGYMFEAGDLDNEADGALMATDGTSLILNSDNQTNFIGGGLVTMGNLGLNG